MLRMVYLISQLTGSIVVGGGASNHVFGRILNPRLSQVLPVTFRLGKFTIWSIWKDISAGMDSKLHPTPCPSARQLPVGRWPIHTIRSLLCYSFALLASRLCSIPGAIPNGFPTPPVQMVIQLSGTCLMRPLKKHG